MARYLNMFTIIGVIMILIGFAGLATGSRFLAEPGQPPTTTSSLLYLAGGAVMLVNGCLSMKYALPKQQK